MSPGRPSGGLLVAAPAVRSISVVPRSSVDQEVKESGRLREAARSF
jgi:hypothetical protein